MNSLAILYILNTLCIVGFYNVCDYIPKGTTIHTADGGMTVLDKDAKGFLWRIDKWGKGKFWYKPIGGCLPCMAGLHSILPYWLFMYYNNSIDLPTLIFYPFYILSLSGIMVFVDAIWNKLES